MIDRAVDTLDSILDRQRQSWLDGSRPSVEELLQDSSLRDDSEAQLDVIYNEVVVREELGENPSVAEYVVRYPHLEEDLALHFEVHHAVQGKFAVGTTRIVDCDTLPDRDALVSESMPKLVDYEVLFPLGQGGMGIVYKARHRRLHRHVALKTFQPGRLPSSRELSRFRTEAEAIARLQHPNIVQIFEIGQAEGLPYLALELAEEGTLAEKLLQLQFKPRAAAELIDTLARAVHHAHEHHIVHRDLKPANVLFTRGGIPKITDFGLAKVLLEDAEAMRDATRTGESIGTPRYMAPEQAAGQQARIGPATDVYALGTLLYECLTGQVPFVSTSAVETMDKIRSEEPVSPRRLQRSIPRDLETICLTCLHKEPSRRYSSAQALSEDLRRFLRGEPVRARPTPAWERVWKWGRRHPAHAALVAVGFLLAFTFLGAIVVHNRLEAKRLAELRIEVSMLMQEGQEALELRDEDTAQARFRDALIKVQGEPTLRDYETGIAGWLDHSRRAANQQRWSQRIPPREFDELRDEAILLSLLLDPLRQEPIRLARQAIQTALELTIAGDSAFHEEREQLILLDADLVSLESDSARALVRLDEAKGHSSRHFHERRAMYLERMGRAAEADGERLRAKQCPPTNPATARFHSGVDQLRRREFDSARHHFDKVLDSAPEHFMARFCLAVCFVHQNRPAEAKVALTACLAQRPRFVWSYLFRGQASLRSGDTNEAIQDFQRGLDSSPPDSARFALLTNKGLLHLQLQQVDQAQDMLEQATTLFPLESSGWENRARVGAWQGRWAEAERHFEKAISLAPKRPGVYRTRSVCYRNAKKWSDALADLDKALGCDSTSSPVRAADQVDRAGLLLHLDRIAEALQATQEALRTKEDDAEAWRLRAEILFRLRHYPEAIAAIDRCKALGVTSFELSKVRGIANGRSGNFLEAIEDYSHTLRFRADADLSKRRGWAYLIANAPRFAQRDFENVLKIDPHDIEAMIGRALAHICIAEFWTASLLGTPDGK